MRTMVERTGVMRNLAAVLSVVSGLVCFGMGLFTKELHWMVGSVAMHLNAIALILLVKDDE